MKELSDKELIKKTKELRDNEKEILHELLLYFGEVDERKLFRGEGYATFFMYLTEGHGYSNASAYRRMAGARLLREHPELLEKLQSGELSFSALVELYKCRKEEGLAELVKESSGKSLEVVEELVAKKIAKPLARKRKESIKVIRPVERKASLPLQMEPESPDGSITSAAEVEYEISFQADEEFMALYREAKAIGGGRLMREVLKKTLKEYTKRNSPKERQKRREARAKSSVSTSSPVTASSPTVIASAARQSPDGGCGLGIAAGSALAMTVGRSMTGRTRHIPVPVKDAVYLRDKGRCTYRSPDGKRCSCQEHLEYDHVKPFAFGGDHSEENIRLLCRAHNQLMAERAFGVGFMNDQRIKGRDLPPQWR